MSNTNAFSSHYYVTDSTSVDYPILRAALVAPAALLVTAGLIWGMERLIFTEPMEKPEPAPHVVPSPVLGEQDVIETRRNPPDRPEESAPEPTVPELDPFTMESSDTTALSIDRRSVTNTKTELMFSADVPIATLLSNPEYPRRAALQGLEGYVDVSFDVQASGATENIRVVHAEPERVFDRAAVNAVKRWKFQPAEKQGKPVAFQGMTHRVIFQMAQE